MRQFVEKLQKEMKVKDEIIGDIKDKLLAKDNENERLQKTNKKLLEIVSSIQLGSPISDPNRKLGELTFLACFIYVIIDARRNMHA